MNALFSPVFVAAGGLVLALLLVTSSNPALWAISLVALAVAIWVAGGRRAYLVLIWLIVFSWLAVAGDLGAADLQGLAIANGSAAQYRELAIYYSLCAMIALAVGM